MIQCNYKKKSQLLAFVLSCLFIFGFEYLYLDIIWKFVLISSLWLLCIIVFFYYYAIDQTNIFKFKNKYLVIYLIVFMLIVDKIKTLIMFLNNSIKDGNGIELVSDLYLIINLESEL